MRITCPGCGSAYEVPDRAVPDPGRDVQCAACGASWFILKGGSAAQDAGPPPSARGPVAQGAPPPDPAPDDDPDRPPDGAPPDPLPRPRVDPAVLAILRAEAETERRARQRETLARSMSATTHPRPAAAPHPAQDTRRDGRPAAAHPTVSGGGNDRLARLTAAERQAPTAPSGLPGSARGAQGDEADTGLVEDPDPARHRPRPPLLDAPNGNGGDGSDRGPAAAAAAFVGARLPVAVVSADRQALVVLQQRRRGFRLGFAATAVLCCAALAVYLIALHAGDRLDGPLSEAVLTRGAQVQATLVDWLRRVVVPALS